MNNHNIISPVTINQFLECQEGRCIRCGHLFSHCKGGDPERGVALPCECCFSKMDGIICTVCAGGDVNCEGR
jgi:hypothetical protein